MQSRIDNLETLATLDKQETYLKNREKLIFQIPIKKSNKQRKLDFPHTHIHDEHFRGLVQVIQQKEWMGGSFICSMTLVKKYIFVNMLL